jgi:hypothetical protein
MLHRWTRAGLTALAIIGSPHSAAAQTGNPIATDGAGRVYFIDQYRDVLWRVDQHRQRTALLPTVHAANLAVTPDGTVYLVTDDFAGTFRWRVTVVPENGPARDTVLTTDIALDGGRTVGADAGGVYFMRESELTQAAFNGQLRTRLFQLRGVALAAVAPTILDRLAVLDGNTIRLSEADTLGVYVIGDSMPGFADKSRTSARFDHPVSIAVGDSGRMYVADDGNARVRKVTFNGDATTLSHALWPWRAMAVAALGDTVFSLERAPLLGLTRVRRIDPDGRIASIAVVTSGRTLVFGVVVLLAVAAVMLVRRGSGPFPSGSN